MSTENHKDLPPELKAFEAELSALVPRADGLDHDRLMFLAGQASASKSRPVTGLVWPAAFGGMTMVATTLAVILFVRPAPEVIERIVRVEVEPVRVEKPSTSENAAPAPVRTASPPALSSEPPSFLASLLFSRLSESDSRDSWKTSYPALRDRILAQGVDSWPQPVSQGDTGPTKPPLTNRQLFEELTKNHS